MAAIERPPVSPQAQAQMGPPGGPAFGQGIAEAQAGMDKSPAEIAVATCEKILMGVQDETFRPYAMKAVATLKVGMAMVQQKQPKSPGAMGGPPQPGGGPPGAPPGPPVPPIPGQMPG
jgi:hypothetical protein